MVEVSGMAYWRPQVMRHRSQAGCIEYAIHEVYFAEDGSVVTYTVDACSDRKATVEELEAWLRNALTKSEAGIVCGDLGYTYDVDDISMWLKHVGDPVIEHEAEDGEPSSGSGRNA